MRSVLFSYEFGSGLGHLNRLIAVAKRLTGAQRMTFAVPNLPLAEPLLRQELGGAVELRQGVVWRAPSNPGARRIPTRTFADVIGLFGYNDAAQVLAAARSWAEIVDEVRPDLIVADFAPTLRLAAQGRMPMVVVGNGYTVPPSGRALPTLRPWQPEIPPSSRANEGRLLTTVNEARAQLAGAAIDYFADLFSGDSTFVCTLREFDPYGATRSDQVWPFNIPQIASGSNFAARTGPTVFCYLPSTHAAVMPVLEALSLLKRSVQIYVQGADPTRIAARASKWVGIHSRPAPLERILPNAAVLLHHAGLGTSYAGLTAGVVQLVLPTNLEHLITARGLQQFGSAASQPTTTAPLTAPTLRDVVESLAEDAQKQQAALESADDLERRRERDPVAKVAAACNAFAPA